MAFSEGGIGGAGGGSAVNSVFTRTGAVVAVAGDYDTPKVNIPIIDSPTFTTVEHSQNVNHSAGWISGGDTSDNGDGTIDISAGTGFLRSSDSDVAQLLSFDWVAASNLAVTIDDLSYVYVEYNSGSPQVVITTTERTDTNTNILLTTIYRNGDDHLHISDPQKAAVGDHALKMLLRLKATQEFGHESGSITTETGTSTRNIGVSAGVWWIGLTQFTTPAVNTDNTISPSDTFTYWYKLSGTWAKITSAQQIDNLQYSTGSALATLGNSKYGVHWVYLAIDGEIHVLYGTANGSLSDASDLGVPSDLPPQFEGHATLIAKIIILKGADVFADLVVVFDTPPIGLTGISQVEDDLSPAFGGPVNLNDFDFNDANGNEMLTHTKVAAAVNNLNIRNAATGTAPALIAEGDNADIDVGLIAKGEGQIVSPSILSLPNQSYFLAYRSSGDGSQNIAELVARTVIFPTEVEDTDSAYDVATGIHTIPAGMSGKWLYSTMVKFTSFSSGITKLNLRFTTSDNVFLGATLNPFVTMDASGNLIIIASAPVPMDALDTCKVEALFEDIAGTDTIDITGAVVLSTMFAGRYLG